MERKQIGPQLWELDIAVRGAGRVRRRGKNAFIGIKKDVDEYIYKTKKQLKKDATAKPSISDMEGSLENIIKAGRIPTIRSAIKYYCETTEFHPHKMYNLDLISQVIGDYPPEDETAVHTLQAHLLKRKIVSTTMRGYFSLLKTVLTKAQTFDTSINTTRIFVQASRLIKEYKKNKREISLSNRDEKDFLELLKKKSPNKLYWPIYFAMYNPIRWGDLRCLLKKNIDLERKVIEYVSQKEKIKAVLLIHDEFLSFMEERANDTSDYKYIFGTYTPKTGDWRQLPRKTDRLMRSLNESSDLEVFANGKKTNFTARDTRHHSATWMAKNGFNLRMIMSVGGWSTIDMVQNYHNLDIIEGGNEAVEYMEELKRIKKKTIKYKKQVNE